MRLDTRQLLLQLMFDISTYFQIPGYSQLRRGSEFGSACEHLADTWRTVSLCVCFGTREVREDHRMSKLSLGSAAGDSNHPDTAHTVVFTGWVG